MAFDREAILNPPQLPQPVDVDAFKRETAKRPGSKFFSLDSRSALLTEVDEKLKECNKRLKIAADLVARNPEEFDKLWLNRHEEDRVGDWYKFRAHLNSAYEMCSKSFQDASKALDDWLSQKRSTTKRNTQAFDNMENEVLRRQNISSTNLNVLLATELFPQPSQTLPESARSSNIESRGHSRTSSTQAIAGFDMTQSPRNRTPSAALGDAILWYKYEEEERLRQEQVKRDAEQGTQAGRAAAEHVVTAGRMTGPTDDNGPQQRGTARGATQETAQNPQHRSGGRENATGSPAEAGPSVAPGRNRVGGGRGRGGSR